MNRSGRELLFDLLILLAVGRAQTSYLLGIGVDPLPTLLLGGGLISLGVLTLVPSRARVPAVIIGLLVVIVAGAIVPRYAARTVRADATLWLSLLLAGIVLLLAFAGLRLTTFRPSAPQLA